MKKNLSNCFIKKFIVKFDHMIVTVNGPTDFNLETVAVNDNGIWLKRIVFERDRRPKFFYVRCC